MSPSEAFREDQLFDEFSQSMQPSDEWESSHADNKSIGESVPEDENSLEEEGVNNDVDDHQPIVEHAPSCQLLPEQSVAAEKSFVSNQHSFVDYLSNLVPTFSVEGSKMIPTFSVEGSKMNMTYGSYSTATYAKTEKHAQPEIKAKKSGSNHSRCIIENTESIKDRRNDHNQFGGANRGGEDCDTRDQGHNDSAMSCSVEEISQISEITMDIQTVVAEQKFTQSCSTLPTISEVKRFDSPDIAACTAGVRSKAQCSGGTDTTKNKSEGNNDIIDFVFELVEDAFCTPMKASKSERKKAFMQAFYEESEKVVKLAGKNGSKSPFRETSKHTRSSASTKSTGISDDKAGAVADMSTHSARMSEHSRIKMVDKPPVRAPGYSTSTPLDEELTLDWSKMMSLAERQLEAEEKSVVSKDSRISAVSKTEKASFYQSMMYPNLNSIDDTSVMSTPEKQTISKPLTASITETEAITTDQNTDENDVDSSATSSVNNSISNSNSTHATLASDVVKELRELSALDSSSFEEESRFLLTSFIFRYVRRLVPGSSKLDENKSDDQEEQEERAFDKYPKTAQFTGKKMTFLQ